MKAAIFHDTGSPDVVRYEDIATPAPGPGEVRIEVRAAAFNHLDVWVRKGLPIETTMPHIGGSDIAGVIAEVGAGVQGIEAGDEVLVNPGISCGHCRACLAGEISLCSKFRILGEHTQGGFAEFVVAPAASVLPLPSGMTFVEAAALPISYGTAWRALISRARLKPGEDVLVIGASGGTATAAIQIARLTGARVLAVTSTDTLGQVRDLGADVVIDRTTSDFADAVRQQTGGRGVDVVVENVGAPTWKGSLRCLAKGARLVTYGATAGPRVEVDLRQLFWQQNELIGSTMASRGEFHDMLRAITAAGIKPAIDRVLPLSEARSGHELIEKGGQFGKVVVVPDAFFAPA